ncbi:cholesterol 7-desaturase nvd isoform X2 [Drosophila nasuta]|uniref:cholesterol 7-desaturase nvd isoform X2 n=1 Tax=Drosophila nasuta TaxID=42062 RepID=UPI00295E63FA|nr:cholesterol 7-desaturase nvd isoform X2 [Drosophila nasuta]
MIGKQVGVQQKINILLKLNCVIILSCSTNLNFFKINVTGKQLGPSYVHLFLHSPIFGSFQIFQTITPVEPLLQKVVHRFYAPRLMAPIVKILICGESIMFERDMNIWDHKIYRGNPQLIVEDSSVKKFRKWYSNFYSVNSDGFNISETLQW